MRIQHRVAGEPRLDWDAYPVPGVPGAVLIVCTAPEGSPDAEWLQRLAQLTGAAPELPDAVPFVPAWPPAERIGALTRGREAAAGRPGGFRR